MSRRAQRELPYGSPSVLIEFWIITWLFAAVLAVLAILEFHPMKTSDYEIGHAIITFAHTKPWLQDAAVVWHYGVGPFGSTVLAVAVMIALVVTKHRGFALYLLACSVGGVLISEVIKTLVGRPRPSWPNAVLVEVGGSFPSGHTMAGIYVWAVVGLICLFVVEGRLGTILGWILIVIGLLAGPSRWFLGVHWPSDVVAGWMLALGWVLLVSAVGLKIADRRRSRNPI
jgi:membrane-associated phospholipid phosphatase